MAKPLGFKDFISVDYTQSGDDQIAYRAKKRKLQDTEEALSFQSRRALARAMKRNKAKLKMGRKRAMQKSATQQTLVKRAQKQARNQLFKKFSKGMSRSELTPQRRGEIEKKIAGMSTRITAIARKLLPDVRKMDKARKGRK